MKPFFILSFFVVVAGTSRAQPVLSVTAEPVTGSILYSDGWYPAAFFDPGSAGENQSWDFTGAGPRDVWITRSYLEPANTPFAAKFPASNLCMRTDAQGPTAPSFTYYTTTDSSVSSLGLGILGGNVIINTMPWDRHYPVQYGETQTDTISGTNSGNGQTVFFKLYYSRIYDAYGTLTSPQGVTYQNSIRLKTTANRRDSIPGANGAYSIRLGAQEYYSWYVPNIPGYLFWTSKYSEIQLTLNANGDTIQQVSLPPSFLVEYQTNLAVPVVDQTAGTKTPLFEIVGNPGRDWLILRFPDAGAEIREIALQDLQGNILHLIYPDALSTGFKLAVEQLPAGLYWVRVSGKNGYQTAGWIKQ